MIHFLLVLAVILLVLWIVGLVAWHTVVWLAWIFLVAAVILAIFWFIAGGLRALT